MTRKLAIAAISTLALAVAAGGATSQPGVEFDTDRLGGDFRLVELRPGDTYQQCAQACVDDAQCLAWTWVPQGSQRAEGPNCWLKDQVNDRGRQSGLVSGLRGYGVEPPRQSPSRAARIVLFEGDDFGGRSLDLNGDISNLHRGDVGFGDSAWSLAANGRWQVCEHIEFGGECRTFEGDNRQLGDFGGTISSVRYLGPGTLSRFLARGDYSQSSGGGSTPAQVQQIVLFEGDGFGGRSLMLTGDTPNLHLQSMEFGDSTWSLAANGRWEVCEHVDFGGECRTFEGDNPQLGDFGGTISSVRYLGPGAASRVASGDESTAGNGRAGQPGQSAQPGQPGYVESAAERAARVAAEEAERRLHDGIREGIGRIF